MADWISAISQAIAVFVAIIGVLVAWRQLSNLVTTLRMNALMAVLQLESEMNARKQLVDQRAADIRKEGIQPTPNAKMVEILNDEMEGYLENWLNSSDRLAFCILKGYLTERDWKVEYRGYFADLIQKYEGKFGAGSIYTNIKDLDHKWKRE